MLQDRLDIPLRAPDGATARLKRTGAPAPLHLAGSLLGYGLLPLRDRAKLGRAALALRFADPADPAVDAQGFGPFMRKNWQTDRAVTRLWSVIVTATLNIDPDAASLALAAKVFRTGLLEDSTGSDLGYAAVPLGEIHDSRARAVLAKQGVDVRDSAKVLSLDADRTVRLRTRDEAMTLRPDAVVLAVPHDVAAGLRPGRRCRAPFAELGHSPILNVHVRYDRPVLDGPFLAGVDSPAQWIFDRTGPSGLPGAGHYVAVTVSAADAPYRPADRRTAFAVRGRTRPAAARRRARRGSRSSSSPGRSTRRSGRPAAPPRCAPGRAPPCPGCTWPARGPPPAGRTRWRARSAAGLARHGLRKNSGGRTHTGTWTGAREHLTDTQGPTDRDHCDGARG